MTVILSSCDSSPEVTAISPLPVPSEIIEPLPHEETVAKLPHVLTSGEIENKLRTPSFSLFHSPENDLTVDDIIFYCFRTSIIDNSGMRSAGYVWVNSITGEITNTLPDGTNPIIARALTEGFPDRWNYPTYTFFYDFEDCRSYLIMFLSNYISLNEFGNIENNIEQDIAGDHSNFIVYRFYVQLDNDPDSEVMIFYINNTNFHIHNQYGVLLNPDGWQWYLPARILTEEEIEARLWALGGAARWYERRQDIDKLLDGVKFYGYATYTWAELNYGESHTGYIWVSTTTGEFETYNNPLFYWINNPLFEISTY